MPASSTQGTITDEQLATLQASNENYIVINQNEIYRLNDKGHTEGIWTYVHDGYNNGGVTKYLNLTVATKAFTITEETGGGGGGGTAEVPVINMSATYLSNLPITDDVVDKMLNKGYVIQNTLQNGTKVIIRLDYVNAEATEIHLIAEEYPDKQVLLAYIKNPDTNIWRFNYLDYLPKIGMYEHKTGVQYENISDWVYVHSINTYPRPYANIDEFVKYVPNFTIAYGGHSYQFMKLDRWNDDNLTVITDGDATNLTIIGTNTLPWDSDNVTVIS